MAIGSVYNAEHRQRLSSARKSVTIFCRVAIYALESAGKNAVPSSVKLSSKRNLNAVMKLKSHAQKVVIGARSPATQFSNVSIPALEIAVTASKEECTSLAKLTVTELESVFTSARSPARRIARLVQRNAKTGVSTASARKRVWSCARLAGNRVPGLAHTRGAPNFAGSHAIVVDAMNHAGKDF